MLLNSLSQKNNSIVSGRITFGLLHAFASTFFILKDFLVLINPTIIRTPLPLKQITDCETDIIGAPKAKMAESPAFFNDLVDIKFKGCQQDGI